MAPNPQCSALNSAMTKKGLSYGQLATQIGQSEQHVIDICTGKVTASSAEFNALARVLDIKDPAPRDSSHSTA